MKYFVMLALILCSMIANAAGDGVRFDVILLKDGTAVDSESAAGPLGTSMLVRLSNGMSVEAIASPPESDGNSRTQVRIKTFDMGATTYVQEMTTRAKLEDSLSFDYAVGTTGLKFRIEVAKAAL